MLKARSTLALLILSPWSCQSILEALPFLPRWLVWCVADSELKDHNRHPTAKVHPKSFHASSAPNRFGLSCHICFCPYMDESCTDFLFIPVLFLLKAGFLCSFIHSPGNHGRVLRSFVRATKTPGPPCNTPYAQQASKLSQRYAEGTQFAEWLGNRTGTENQNRFSRNRKRNRNRRSRFPGTTVLSS